MCTIGFTMFDYKFGNILDDRTRLSGMEITGPEHVLYKDRTNITACNGVYGYSGQSPCDDVLEIPINTSYYTQLLTISTVSYLTLCEVEVYAGWFAFTYLLIW